MTAVVPSSSTKATLYGIGLTRLLSAWEAPKPALALGGCLSVEQGKCRASKWLCRR